MNFLKLLNAANIFYHIVRFILRSFAKSDLTEAEAQFVDENARKHAKVQWINLAASILVIVGLQEVPSETISQISSTLLAPVVVVGGGWFVMSFGAVPRKLIAISMEITFWMFMAFMISLSTMFITILMSVNPLTWPCFALIYIGIVISCILYDTTDGLKAGLDEAMLRHSRAAWLWYLKSGIKPEDVEEK